MPRSHPVELRETALELLRAGTTQKRVAQLLGVSKSWVDTVAAEIRQERAFFRESQALAHRRHRVDPKQIDRFAQRCPGCGHRVLMPCLKCSVDVHRKGRLAAQRQKGRIA